MRHHTTISRLLTVAVCLVTFSAQAVDGRASASGSVIGNPTSPSALYNDKAGTVPAPVDPKLALRIDAKQRAALQNLARGGARYYSWAFQGDQQPQQTTYWCGPAAASEASYHLYHGQTQSTMAWWLGTTTNGTNWYGGSRIPNSTGYPMVDALNYTLGYGGGYGYYAPIAVAYTPSSTDYSHYKSNLVYDLDGSTGYRYPLVGDAWEVGQGPHLAGHPSGYTIFHFFEIRGYDGAGAYTQYEDSVAGSGIAWAASVPPYSTLANQTIVQIVGGRGYVW